MLCKTLVYYGYRVGFEKFFANQEQALSESSFLLKKTVPWHGLAVDEPLNLEMVIKNTYLNPDRKKFPSMWTGDKKIELILKKTSAEYFMATLGLTCMK